MSFPISLSVQVYWLSLTPYHWVSQNNHFHIAEGSSQGVQSIDAAASFTAADKQKKIDQSVIDYYFTTEGHFF